jgi:transglutaminase-like putative cysteine protease
MRQPLCPTSLVAGEKVWPGPATPMRTLQLMKQMTLDAYQQPALVEIAVGIARMAQEKNPAATARALMWWLRAYTRFVADPLNEQLLKSPAYMLALVQRDGTAGGDCVDIAMLAAALAMAVGLPAKFVAEGYEWDATSMHADLVHVYTVVQTQRDWVALDTQRTADAAPAQPLNQVEVTIP